MNTAYILEENKKILDGIAMYHEISSVNFILEIRRMMKEPPEFCRYQSNLNREQLYKDIFQLQSLLENYYSMAKSVNSVLISQDDQIRKKFWNIASVLAGNNSLAESLKHSKFPELSNYQKQQRKGTRQIFKQILLGKSEEDAEEPGWKGNVSEMFEDIKLISEQEYYLYGLRLLRNTLLEINCSRIPGETQEVTDLTIQ